MVLLDTFLLCFLIHSKARWERDIGGGVRGDRLSTIFILHMVYRTLEFSYSIGLRSESACARCDNSGTLIHLLWRCPKLHRHWEEVVGTLNGLFDLNIPVQPLKCLLDYLDPLFTLLPFLILFCMLFLWPADKLLWGGPLPILPLYPIELDLNRLISFEKHIDFFKKLNE